MSETTIYRWPVAALTGDLVRGGFAVLVTLLLLLVTPVLSLTFAGLVVLALLFGFYLGGTVSRVSAVVAVDDEGLKVTGGLFGPKVIKWSELQRFELRHFPLSRDRTKGWMDLKLKAGGRSVAIDDKIERFDALLARAWTAAQAAEIGISDATHHNLVAAGIVPKAKI